MKKKIWISVAAVLGLLGIVVGMNYRSVVIWLAPVKQATVTRSDAAIKADALMWQALHAGDYEKIPQVLAALTAAYLENPGDVVTTAHVGFMHMWRLVERSRLSSIPPTITDDAVLARKYFQEAVALDPHDARYLGFLGSATLAEGGIHHDARTIRRGYFLLRDAIDAWPAFNLFTAGYSLSRQPVDSPQFAEALAFQWRNIDVCAMEKVDRNNPDFSTLKNLTGTDGDHRACANTPIAPHNFEGFFLNMGDMLVKAGEWRVAKIMYANARLSPGYAAWKFRGVLGDRIAQAERNVALFNQSDRRNEKPAARIMVNSTFACVGCHQD